MSTTVTYKGDTLATVSNNTKTLKTAGKYMEGDVVLTDVSAGAPNVWQDQDGYVHLDDEGATPITIEALSITQNGTYTATTGHAYSPVTVNVSGGGSSGLEYEEGTWTPNVDTTDPTILFSGNHINAPFFVMMTDITGTYDDTTGVEHAFLFCDWEKAFGEALIANSTSYIYALKRGVYRSSTTGLSNTGLFVNSREDAEEYVDNTKFVPRYGNSPTTWKAGHTYKWIAVWSPAT